MSKTKVNRYDLIEAIDRHKIYPIKLFELLYHQAQISYETDAIYCSDSRGVMIANISLANAKEVLISYAIDGKFDDKDWKGCLK